MLLQNLFTVCAHSNHFPTPWKNSIGVEIPKANKPDYAVPKAFKIITLFTCLRKLYERIILIRQTLYELTHLPLYRLGAGQSHQQAVIHLLSFVAREQARGYIPMTVFVDLRGTTDHVSHQRLQETLLKARVPHYIVNTVMSFLSERHITVKFYAKIAEGQQITSGIPQGSPLSPLLFCTYPRPLLDTIKEADYFHISYVDDISLLFSASEWRCLYAIANKMLAILTHAASSLNISCNHQKMEVIVLHRKLSDTTQHTLFNSQATLSHWQINVDGQDTTYNTTSNNTITLTYCLQQPPKHTTNSGH